MENNILFDKQEKKYLVKRLNVSDAKPLSYLLNALSDETTKLFRPHSFNAVFIKGLLKNRKDVRLGLYTIKNKKIIAYAFVNKIPLLKIGYFGIEISEEFRGRSLAPKLMSYLFNISKKEGINKIILNVYGRNIKALRLYKKYGFKTLKINSISRGLLIIYEILKNYNLSDLMKIFSEKFLERRKNDGSFVVWMTRNL